MSISSQFRKYGKMAAVMVVIIVTIVSAFSVLDRVFRIEEIRVSGAPVRLVVDKKKLTRNLLFFPTDLIRNQLLADNPLMSSIMIKKKYPHTLDIIVSVREGVARLSTGGQEFLVDAGGVIIGESTSLSQNLPIITINTAVVHIGDAVRDPGFLSALSFIRETRGSLEIEQIEVFDSASLRAKIEKIDILFPQQASMKDIATTLQTIFSGFRIKGTLPTRIDLRFEKPIVTF